MNKVRRPGSRMPRRGAGTATLTVVAWPRRHIGVDRVVAVARDADAVAVERAGIVDDQREVRVVAGVYRLHASRRNPEPREIAKRMQDRVDAERGEQKRQHETEAQVVVDRSGQHQQQRADVDHAVARGQDEDAPLHQHDAAGSAPRSWNSQSQAGRSANTMPGRQGAASGL